MADERVFVTVIAVPFYYKDAFGKPDKDNMQSDADGFPDEVELTAYDKYDFEVEHPDIVIYQCPYDEYSDAFTIHPYYYAKNIRKYAEKLVLIPPFSLRHIAAGDMRSRISLKSFTNNIGSVLADKIIVQSDNVAEVFIENLDNFIISELESDRKSRIDSAENDKSCSDDEITSQNIIDWSERVSGAGSACIDWEKRSDIILHDTDNDVYYSRAGVISAPAIYDRVIDVPEGWIQKLYNEGNIRKKVIVLYISASVLFEHGKKALGKFATQIEQIIKKSDDMVVLWHTDRFCRDVLRKNHRSTWNMYSEILKDFAERDIGILDESTDEERAAYIADAMFGDAGTLMNRIQGRGKPILWETPPAFMKEGKDIATPWSDEINISIEGSDSLDRFLDEVLEKNIIPPDTTSNENAVRMWKAIMD